MVLYCRKCGALVSAEHHDTYRRGDPDEGPQEVISFLRCPACSDPFLVLQEDYGELSEPEVLYPAVTRLNPNLPKPILAAYAEADSCFRGKAYTAAAIMCRKTLEGLCAEHGVTKRPLIASLGELRDKGIIDGRLYEWSDTLRVAGNEAAHDVGVTVSAEDARDLVEFTNAILEYVFTFRDRYEAFKLRRSGAPKAG
jgi:uncharacterized protein DUF4145